MRELILHVFINRINTLRFTVCLGLISSLATPASADSVIASDGGKSWQKWDVKTVSTTRTPHQLSKFGGVERYRVAGPGFFRTIEKKGKWWMIDPDGYLFFSIGVNSVRASRVGASDEKAWALQTHDLLKSAGFNTIGRWSDNDSFVDVGKPIAWCSSLSFMKEYAKKRSEMRGESGFPNETIPVFDAEWPDFCEEYALKKAGPLADDRWLLGHFSDNELPFRPDALNKYLELPEGDAGHLGTLAWMVENRVRERDLDDPEVQADFLEYVARLYFETVASALKKADPNHLYIGSRIHGRCINESVLRASNACDIVSINYYHRWVPEKDRARDWEKWSERPFLVGEFYAMKVESERTEPEGVGFRVLNHEDAGAFYHTFTAAMQRSIPSCVGWHWFKYSDDDPTWQKGIVSTEGAVHQTLIDAMKQLNLQAYSLRGAR